MSQEKYCSETLGIVFSIKKPKTTPDRKSKKSKKTGKPRFQPGAGNWHRSEPEPVELERETEPVEPEPAGYY